MAMASQRLNTSQSQGGLSQSRLSDTRKQKLMSLKAREDLKDALKEKFASRYGAGGQPNEAPLPSDVISQEVDRFASTAKVTEANLDRLERRLHHKANQGPNRGQGDAQSVVSAYSAAGSNVSRSRSVPSIAGKSIMGMPQGTDQNNFDWSKLDEYAAYLHQQDALRQRLGQQALQKKMRGDLDAQVMERKRKQDMLKQEDDRYHQSAMHELERWKMAERAKEEDRYEKVMREKQDRDEQLEFERQLKAHEQQQKKQEDTALVQKIVTEMESEQRRFERKREMAKKSMKKVFEENLEDQRRREQLKKEEAEQEARAMEEYNRILDEQEEQRAEEMQARLERQNKLMKQLQVSVGKVQKDAGNEDMSRASQQMEEMDRHFFEAEQMKQQRLKQLRLENQAYLFKQMDEKKGRLHEEKHLQNVQAQILKYDTEDFHEKEKQKHVEMRGMFLDHRKELEQQIMSRQNLSFPTMSEQEVKMNAPLLNLVQRSLAEKDEWLAHQQQQQRIDEEED